MNKAKLLFLFVLPLIQACTFTPAPEPDNGVRPTVEVKAATTIPGYDVLGVAKFCTKFIQAPKLPAVSSVIGPFGDPLPCIEDRVKRGGVQVVQIDPADCTAERNGKERPGAVRCSDPGAMKKRAAMIQPYCSRHPDVRYEVTCGLEDDVKDMNLKRKVCAAVQDGCPCCKVRNSPFTGARPPEYPLELHGTKVSSNSVSGDGASSLDGDNLISDGNNFQHRTAGDLTSYAWTPEFNGRCTGEKTFTFPENRTNWPSGDLFYQLYLVMSQPEQPKPAAPGFCKRVREVGGHEILKTNAELYCNGTKDDGRGGKPLLIINKNGKRGDRVKVYTPSGKEVGSFGYYGPFTEKPLQRWYMGVMGSGQTPYKLYLSLGGEWGYVKLDSTTCLRINALRRMGITR